MSKISAYVNGEPLLGSDEFVYARAGLSKKATHAGLLATQRRNLVINGDFRRAQRSATYALTTAFAYGSVDRWMFAQGGTAAGAANQATLAAGALPGFRNYLKLGRTAGSALTGFLSANYAIETLDALWLAGQPCVLSWYAAAGANFSAASGNMSIDLSIGTGTDQAGSSYPAGGWTGQSQRLGAAQAVSTVWTRYSRVLAALPNTTSEIGIQLGYTPVGVAGADDNLFITGVQLEPGSSLTNFDFRHEAQELALCQRYYERMEQQGANLFVANGFNTSTTVANAIWKFCQRKRVAPTFASSTAANFTWQHNANTALTALAAANINLDSLLLTCTVAAGLTGGQGGQLINTNAGTFIAADSEL